MSDVYCTCDLLEPIKNFVEKEICIENYMHHRIYVHFFLKKKAMPMPSFQNWQMPRKILALNGFMISNKRKNNAQAEKKSQQKITKNIYDVVVVVVVVVTLQ